LSEAVGAAEYELMDGLQIRVRQRCGQCGVWRRIVTGPAVVALHKRNLEADQMRIQRRLERLARGRTPVDADAFHNR
jgi:hypothetical protein